ncbi:hypothetical protein [Bradyrhizobium symbiodeficiens]|uniref:hypothetical protein n=1 Tax=Bradyrhizobium symbiodeficiens TaxID=1404367 RepID=UPI0011E4D17A|nr:hypothetical protein [Bradyrhizobium symbiodeficiens]
MDKRKKRGRSETGAKNAGPNLATRLERTIKDENPQKLIELMQEARSLERRSEFAEAVKAVITGVPLNEYEWHNLEYFVIEADLTDGGVRDCLERVQARSELKLDARISVYSMLQRCGSARLLALVSSDADLRAENPAIWMDLVAASTPETTAALREARQTLLDQITTGNLGGWYLLERMRLIAKLAIGAEDDWLSRLLDLLSREEADAVEAMIDRLFSSGATRVGVPQSSLDRARGFFADTNPANAQFDKMDRAVA